MFRFFYYNYACSTFLISSDAVDRIIIFIAGQSRWVWGGLSRGLASEGRALPGQTLTNPWEAEPLLWH